MKIELDIQKMRDRMELWGYVPAVPGGTVEHTGASLDKARVTMTGWVDLLRLCSADASHQPTLRQITAEVKDAIG